jgi:hypothetical protein
MPRRVTLNPWRPNLIDGGPSGIAMRRGGRREVVLADLACIDDEELLVVFVPRDSGSDWARDAVVAWAARVGWRRVWLDDRVVDLAEAPAVAGRARVRCPTCGMRWEDERPEFWDNVRDDGWFPPSCLACGGSLPEWEVDEPRTPHVDEDERRNLNRRVR